MLRLDLSREADADLVGMLEYGAEQFGWDAAEAYVARFDQTFALLCEYPEIGAVQQQVRPPSALGHTTVTGFSTILRRTQSLSGAFCISHRTW